MVDVEVEGRKACAKAHPEILVALGYWILVKLTTRL